MCMIDSSKIQKSYNTKKHVNIDFCDRLHLSGIIGEKYSKTTKKRKKQTFVIVISNHNVYYGIVSSAIDTCISAKEGISFWNTLCVRNVLPT